jgi:glycosyltransferase involved in cell wall biosynthesis
LTLPPETSAPNGLAVSVALCTYNGARFIREQVRSICLQTRPPREIVLSDDASSDGCVEFAREEVDACNASRPDSPVALRVLRNATPLRVTKNFEQAVRACDGDLIALCDQDDVWLPDRLARMSAEFDRRPGLVLLFTDARRVDEARRELGASLFDTLEVEPAELARVHGGEAFDVLLRRNLAAGATTIFRRALLDDALPFPAEWLHDEWLAILAAALGGVDLLEAPLIEYRQHGANQVGARSHGLRDKIRKALAARGEAHAKRLRKAERLLERLLALGARVPPAAVEKARAKVAHQRVRAALPAPRIARCVPVLREAVTGRYGLYGYGARGALRDLLEAA